jgi:uncharacterized protein
MTAEEETIVRRVRLELEKLYGNRLRKVILYGSRARGDAHEDSDYDFLAVLDSLGDRPTEVAQLDDLAYDLMVETGDLVSIDPITEPDLARRTLFMHGVRADGLIV